MQSLAILFDKARRSKAPGPHLDITHMINSILGSGKLNDTLTTQNNATPLHMAAWTNSDAVAALLICHGASLDAEDKV